MYQSFFGFKLRPFDVKPHVRNFFPASGQAQALATLRYAVTQGRGIGLLTGPAGTGKTLVCQRLTTSLETAYRTATLTNTNMTTIKALYQAILYDLSLPYHGLDEQELRLTVTDFLLGKYAGGGRTVLIIDEAQNLSMPLLEELRVLSNIDGDADKLFQIVLVGHSRLLGMLRSPELETLNQRVGARATLRALDDEETAQYVQHQLQYAGVLPDAVFTSDALTAIYEASGGIPRVINQLCENAMLLAYGSEMHRVDAELVEMASTALELPVDRPEDHDAQFSGASAMSATLAEAMRDHTIGEEDNAVVCDEESGICLAYAPDEGADTCLEIIDDESAPACDKSFEIAMCGDVTIAPTGNPLDEVFAQEEIIVDPYAMMDAARSAARQTPRPIQLVAPIHAIEPTLELPPAPAIFPIEEIPQCISVVGEEPIAMLLGEYPIVESPAPVDYVEPSDNPAVHEVGAGVAEPQDESNEPPILVIESRSQRVAGNLARVDKPETTGPELPRAYRRLFTHARKP
jgi:type II secretory pathway predicted ATPase ExeA